MSHSTVVAVDGDTSFVH